MALQNDFNNLIVRPIWPPKNGNSKTVKEREMLNYFICKGHRKNIFRCTVGVQTITEIKCNDP